MNTRKEILYKKLIAKNCFWSFNTPQNSEIPDDILIEKSLIYLDIDDINQLFKIYSPRKIKKVWRERLIIQGDYYRRLNRLLAWMYFDIKNPDQYIHKNIRQHLNSFKGPH
jgi:hypothetical protein